MGRSEGCCRLRHDEYPKADGKVVAPKVHLKRTGEPVRSPKTISGDKRLSRLISYIHHTCEYKQYCYVA